VKTPFADQTSDGPADLNLQHVCDLLRRFFLIAVFVFFAALAPSSPATADTDPTEFIDILGNQAFDVLRDATSLHQKQTYFDQLFRQDFDLSGIPRFVLGSYWRVASEPERQEFQQLFEYRVMMTYGPRLADYRAEGGKTARSERARGDEPDYSPPRRSTNPIDWRLSVCDGLYKISDIVVDGVSMAATQRSEFAQMIQRNGGRVENLLAMMRQER
jgi:phospholipid transport system substrate-binding protein